MMHKDMDLSIYFSVICEDSSVLHPGPGRLSTAMKRGSGGSICKTE